MLVSFSNGDFVAIVWRLKRQMVVNLGILENMVRC